ncbi:heptaprenyl diphosphate synthase component II [Bacillus thermotolerans]|uniref:Heptaprenyl diphosphate synthase component 2 n=1 Tax=Bacillus thermotolerans TaxID=1221996 RepID=A0A0F5HX84_BACTR|nr:heptaprenyl diphosphate synthase component II [Bacillus thermotolerans]KKB35922.1 Heptaprenyl diphosphate synthase component II [Bacillus thermotolerans]KKB37635.1 Heptaprenyl diphosphate synthase component II [Bacillus thermotolerans]KKB38450.1 Heptaprenyl diphosphate synthase component II [Bacillus thermotolerans]
MKVTMLYSFLKADIEYIERELEQAISSSSPSLRDASLHLLQAGGKRIRPVFVLLAAKFGDYRIERVKNVAVALELIHMASLVHDDVIDNAKLRRGQPTVKAEWDNRMAMYTGDYIFARALEYMTDIENAEAHRILSNTMVELCIGEINQIKDKYQYSQNLRDYLRRIKRKTAILMAASCQLGALAADVPDGLHQKFYQFGYNVGMAFQITDDILDFTATEKELGKPAGSDLLQGNVTLPALYALEDERLREQIMQVGEHTTKQEMAEIIHQMKRSDVLDRSRALSQRYLRKALVILDELPSNRTKKSLRDIAKFVGKRKY